MPGDVPAAPALARVLSLPLLVLYGLGVTIGAGIYVLIGAAAGRAGIHAPAAFVLAAVAMGFSAASFAELSTRLPVSAGEAAYVRAGLGSARLALLTGLLVVVSALVSSAAITIGGIGYLREFVPLPETMLVVLVLLLLGGAAAWGVLESVSFASLFTVIEVAGLLVIIGAGLWQQPDILLRLPEILPSPRDSAALSAVAATSLLAFFAFIGFEDLVNLAEEARDPVRDMPRAIFVTLIGATVIYVLVVFVAVSAVPNDELAKSNAPLSLVFERLTGASPAIVTAIAIVATFNGVIVQIVMASRVLYGLSAQRDLPAWLGVVDARTRTPLRATALVVLATMSLALFLPLGQLAQWTSQIILTVFTLVNLSLLRMKLTGAVDSPAAFAVPFWVPLIGAIVSVAMLATGWLLD
ncbi:MAG: APC family permease [Burkholderiaceae bacterium]